jgi:hypothetical protein
MWFSGIFHFKNNSETENVTNIHRSGQTLVILVRPLEMKVTLSSETSGSTFIATQRHIPNNRDPSFQRCENVNARKYKEQVVMLLRIWWQFIVQNTWTHHAATCRWHVICYEIKITPMYETRVTNSILNTGAEAQFKTTARNYKTIRRHIPSWHTPPERQGNCLNAVQPSITAKDKVVRVYEVQAYRGIDPLFLRTRLWRLVGFTLRQFHPSDKIPRYRPNRRLCEAPSHKNRLLNCSDAKA